MRLLICTQKLDQTDPILGFFHDWVEIFASKCEQVTVICLYAGTYVLPDNVRVMSLGKEEQNSRLGYIQLFYKYIWQARKEYDTVFVHMNTIYLVLAGWWWRICQKRVALWYIHPKVDRYLFLVVFFANYIFTASDKSFPLKTKKLEAVGHGINTKKFVPDSSLVKSKNSLLFVGRLTPIKKLDLLVEAVRIMQTENFPISLRLVGEPDKRYESYYKELRSKNHDLETTSVISYHGAVINNDMPKLYNQHEILVNLTPNGSFDKAVLEAAACGTLVVSSNELFKTDLPKELLVTNNDAATLAKIIKNVLQATAETKNDWSKQLRQMVVDKYDLENLISRIVKILL